MEIELFTFLNHKNERNGNISSLPAFSSIQIPEVNETLNKVLSFYPYIYPPKDKDKKQQIFEHNNTLYIKSPYKFSGHNDPNLQKDIYNLLYSIPLVTLYANLCTISNDEIDAIYKGHYTHHKEISDDKNFILDENLEHEILKKNIKDNIILHNDYFYIKTNAPILRLSSDETIRMYSSTCLTKKHRYNGTIFSLNEMDELKEFVKRQNIYDSDIILELFERLEIENHNPSLLEVDVDYINKSLFLNYIKNKFKDQNFKFFQKTTRSLGMLYYDINEAFENNFTANELPTKDVVNNLIQKFEDADVPEDYLFKKHYDTIKQNNDIINEIKNNLSPQKRNFCSYRY